jgi:hypothetical protein
MSIDEQTAEIIALSAVEAADLPPEVAALVGAGLSTMDPGTLMCLIGDAISARAYLEDGKPEQAREIIERYRDMAESMGLGPMMDTMFEDI